MRRWLPERLTPLQRFAILSFVGVLAITIAVCGVGAELLSRHLIRHDAALVGDLTGLLLTRSLPEAFFVEPPGDPTPYEWAAAEIVAAADVVRVVLYDLHGRVLWSDDAALIGHDFRDNDELEAALAGRIAAHVVRPGKAEHQGALRALGRVEEIYVPVRYRKGGPVVGVVEVYRHTPAFFAVLDRGMTLVWLLGGGSGLVLYVAMLTAVSPGLRRHRASRPIVTTPRPTAPRRVEAALRRLNDTLEAEAKRIALELHDEAGQLLAAAHIALQEATSKVPAAAQDSLRQVSGVLDQVEEDLRRLAHELRPRILDDLGLDAALKFLGAGVARRTGLEVRIVGTVGGRLPPVVETALYRVVKEALTNAARHAHASAVLVAVARSAAAVRCTIADDGDGFDLTRLLEAGANSLGLRGVRNRVEVLGGDFLISSAPGRGTTLTLTIPVDP